MAQLYRPNPAPARRRKGAAPVEPPPLSNPRDLRGRKVPARYLSGLPRGLQAQRVAELTQSRDDYAAGRPSFADLPTDRAARRAGLVKRSRYRDIARARGFDRGGPVRGLADQVAAAGAYYLPRGLTRAQQQHVLGLAREVYRRGLAAWQSGGHRPGASQASWGLARVASFLVGGRTARTADRDLFSALPAALAAAIEAEAPPDPGDPPDA
jgi:hypothetical protein